jgi:hypothetical protein
MDSETWRWILVEESFRLAWDGKKRKTLKKMGKPEKRKETRN